MTDVQTERLVIDNLVDLWNSEVRPHVIPNACVLSARIASEVLAYFNIHHTTLSMAVMAMNDRMLEHEQAGVSYTNWDPDAWSVGVGFNQMVATKNDYRDSNGFCGHVIAITNHHYVDLTAYQFDRIPYGIETGGSMVIPFSDIIHPFTLNPESPNSWFYAKLKQGHMVMLNNQNNDYKHSPDWRVNYKRQTGDIIRTIKKRISENSSTKS